MAKKKGPDKPDAVTEPDAFGMTPSPAPPEEEKEQEPKKVAKPGEGEEEAPPKEEKPLEEEEEAEEPSEEEEPPEEEEEPELTPEAKALMEKKGFKSISDVAKAYSELERRTTRTDQVRSVYRKALEPYATFDEDGNIVGTTEEGRRVTEPAGPKMSPEQQAEAFNRDFKRDPVGTILALGYLASQETLKKFSSRLEPLEEAYSESQLIKMVDKVAEESDDEKFFDEYEERIADEIKKLPVELRKTSPEVAVRQAYVKVKSDVLKELQSKPRKKKGEEEEEEPAEKGKTHLERPAKGGKKLEKKEGEEVFEGMKKAAGKKGGSHFG